MKHVIAVLLENEPGALSRVVALFSARGYNIESLTVAPTEDPSLSRMTIAVDVEPHQRRRLRPPPLRAGAARSAPWARHTARSTAARAPAARGAG